MPLLSIPPLAGEPAGCTPGADGIPGGPLGGLACGDWLPAMWHLLATGWVWLAALACLGLAARIGWAIWRRRRWYTHAAGASWMEITPPVSATPAATVQLWRLAATLLPAPRRWTLRPARLVWEAAATPDAVRVGLWVPSGINTLAVNRVVQRAWPGARVEHALAPQLPDGQPVAGHRLVVTQPEWLPLLDDPPPTGPRRPGAAIAPEEDRLRAVYDGLAAAGRTGFGLLQVHISRAPRSRVAMLRRATVDPHRARRRSGGQAAGVLLAAATTLVRAVLDLATGQRTTSSRGQARDPYTTQLTAQARTKYGDPPHLLTTVHAAAAGPTKPAAQAAAADISSGYGLVSAQLSRHRLRRARMVVDRRWAPVAGMTLVSVTEAAALAGLPAEPSAFGLPAAAARSRMPSRDVWTPTAPTTATTAPGVLHDGGMDTTALFTLEDGDTP